MPEITPTRPIIAPSGPVESLTLESLSAQVAALQTEVANLITSSRGWNATASDVTKMQTQLALLNGHTHLIANYKYTVSATTGENFGRTTTTYTVPAIEVVIVDPLSPSNPVPGENPVMSGPPQSASTSF